MQAQRYGYTQMINNAILTNSSYKLRFAQDLTLYLGELALDIPELDLDAGKTHWLEDPVWQGTRKSIESVMGATDFLEQYFATNVIVEPLVAELFRSGLVMQLAAAQNDFMTPAVVSAAEGDFERNLANAVELFRLLAQDEQHAQHNRALFTAWLGKHGAEARNAALQLQPIWSQPRVKIAQFGDALEQSRNRLRAIGAEIGLDVRAIVDA
jgi:propane monooxygenase small subunit